MWRAKRALVFSLVFFCCWASVCALAAAPSQQAGDEEVITHFHQWCVRFVAAPGAESQTHLLPEGLALANKRREALQRIIREDPARALTLTESASVRRSLPAEINRLLEERVSGVGQIRVRRDGSATAEVSADGLAREARVNGRVFAVHVYGWRLVDQDFDGIPLQGVAVDGVLAVAESPLRILEAEEIPPQQREAGKIGVEVGGQLQFFATREEVIHAELDLMYPRGLPIPGPEQEAAWARIRKVRRVHPNLLAWQRVNQRRKEKGMPLLSQGEMKVVPLGQELELEGDAVATDDGPPLMAAGNADNSMLPYFPPIRSQSPLGSCAAFSTTYYQMTHMTALARGWDAKNGGDAYRFSPKWTYNMTNGGADKGVWEYYSLSVQRDHGCATWAEYPYDGDYRAWCLNSNVWRAAIDRRMNNYYTIGSLYTSNGLANLKSVLDDGYVVTFDTYCNWDWGAIANDPATTNDDVFVGEQIIRYVRALDWGHAMTVVGYNDDIWCDLNGNGSVDPGEKGALKIANSWGNWANDGYIWFAYDGLKTQSAVPGWDPVDKAYGFGHGDSAGNCKVYVVTAKPSYTPLLLACFTVNHAQRSQVTMVVGKDSGTPTNNPSTQWTSYGLSGDGGSYAFDGTTNACDATFWLDMSNLSPELGEQKRYFIGMVDNPTAGSGQLKSFTLVDTATGVETTIVPTANPSSFNPSDGTANGYTAWGFQDHKYAVAPLQAMVPVTATEGDGVLAGQGQISIIVASTNDQAFALSSSDISEVVVPATVTVLAGQTNATFDVTIVDDAILDGDQSATITAMASGYVTANASLVVHDNETAILTVTLPTAATEGQGELVNAGTVTVNAPVAVDVTISLDSSDANEVVVPSTVTVLAGQTAGAFNVTIVDDDRLDGPQTATVTAHVANWTGDTAVITVLDNENNNLTVNLPDATYEGDGVLTNTGSVGISGTLPSDLNVTLQSSDLTELAVPSTVTIPAGQTNALFDLTVVEDAVQDGVQIATVTASAVSFNDGSADIAVKDDEVSQFTLSFITSPQSSGSPFALSIAALDMNGSTITVYNSTIGLSGDGDSGPVSIQPTSISTWTNGIWTSLVRVNTVDANVRLTANDGAGHTGLSNPFNVEVGPLDHFGWSIVPSPQRQDVPFPVAVTALDAGDNKVTDFTGTISLSATGSVCSANNMILGNITNSGSIGAMSTYTFGYSFTPNIDLTVTHVRHYSGTKVSLWTDNGVLLATQAVTSVPGAWVETPLVSPIQLQAANRYRVAFSVIGTAYSRNDSSNSFMHGTINQSYQGLGDGFPTTTDSERWWFVDLRYTFCSPVAVPLTPTNSDSFASGMWTGLVTILGIATNVVLTADDDTGHSGTSMQFHVEGAGVLTVAPSNSLSFVGPIGGLFSPASQVYSLANTGLGSLNWSATNTAAWVNFSPSAGTLPLGASTNIIVSINSNATSLAIGSYTDTITFTNITSGLGTTDRSVSLTVTVPSPTTILADAGNLSDRWGTLASSNSIALLVVDTGNNGFVDPQPAFSLSVGATWGADDKVVGLWDLTAIAAQYGDGQLFDQTVVAYTNGVAPGQKLQLYWFPSLTLASNTVGVTYYGKYTDTNSPPLDGSDEWEMPVGGSSVHLKFWTASWSGSNPEAAGWATWLTATAYQIWQQQHFGCIACPQAAESADPEGDGQNNLAEFLAGTDPTSAASAFRILSLSSEGDDVCITWRTASGRTNAVQAAIGEADGCYTTNFIDLSGPITILGSGDVTTNYLDVGGATNIPSRYYRIRLVP